MKKKRKKKSRKRFVSGLVPIARIVILPPLLVVLYAVGGSVIRIAILAPILSNI